MTALPRNSDDNDSGSEISDRSDEDRARASEFPGQLFMTKDDKRKKSIGEEKSTTDHRDSKKATKRKPNKKRDPDSKKSGEKKHIKSSAKKKKSSDKSHYGGSAMPRQKAQSASDGGGRKSSLMATLENLMNPPEHAIKNRKDGDNDATSQGTQDHDGKQGVPSRLLETLNHSMRGKFGGGDKKERDDDNRGANHENQMADSSMHASKRSRKGLLAVKQNSVHNSLPSRLDISEACDDSKSSTMGESNNQSKRRSRKRSDLNGSMSDRLDYSIDDAGGDRSNRRSKRPQQRHLGRDMNASISDVSGDEGHRSSSKAKGGREGKSKGLNSSQPDRLDYRSDDVGHPLSGLRKVSNNRQGRKRQDMNASMPDCLGSGDESNDDVERRRGSHRKAVNKTMNASMPDRLDTMQQDMSSGSRLRAENHRRRSAQNDTKGRLAGGKEHARTDGSMASSFEGTVGVPKTDAEALLEVMSETMAKDLYFPEVGYFDWKKWRKRKTKRRRRRRKRRGPKGGRARPTRPNSTRRSISPDRPARRSLDPNDKAMKLSSADQTPHHRSIENRNSVTDDMPHRRSMENTQLTTRVTASTQVDQSMPFDDFAAEANPTQESPVVANIDFGMFSDSKEGSGDFGVVNSSKPDTIKVASRSNGPDRNLDAPVPSLPQKPHSDLEGDNEKPLLSSRKAPARDSRIIGVGENVEEASFDHLSGQLVRQDSAARELKKLATFMTAIDVLSKQEPVVTQAPEQSACCVIQ